MANTAAPPARPTPPCTHASPHKTYSVGLGTHPHPHHPPHTRRPPSLPPTHREVGDAALGGLSVNERLLCGAVGDGEEGGGGVARRRKQAEAAPAAAQLQNPLAGPQLRALAVQVCVGGPEEGVGEGGITEAGGGGEWVGGVVNTSPN